MNEFTDFSAATEAEVRRKARNYRIAGVVLGLVSAALGYTFFPFANPIGFFQFVPTSLGEVLNFLIVCLIMTPAVMVFGHGRRLIDKFERARHDSRI